MSSRPPNRRSPRPSSPTVAEQRLAFLPLEPSDVKARGWDAVDIVFVTGDAYVDHPSFAMAILGRTLEARGFRVAILSQPDWKSADPFKAFGPPRLFFAISAGNMDSMINHYTANRRIRSDDAYSPGGRAGLRPDKATAVYAQRCREACPGVPIITGGVEASLRRLVHYDYWSDTVKPSMMVSSKADLTVFGMGEQPIVTIAQRLAAGESVKDLRDLRSVTYMLGAKEELPEFPEAMKAKGTPADHTRELPSFDTMRDDKEEFARGTHAIHVESNPYNGRRLIQKHGTRLVVQNPPALPLTTDQMDAAYDLPYQRRAHPAYSEPIPAEQMMRSSVTIMRGCFGGCTFCSITAHQGRIIQSRSQKSILKEVEQLEGQPGYKGVVSDLGGPTANMYEMRCTKPDVEAVCRRLSCVYPKICKLLGTDHGNLVELLGKARETKGVKRIDIASGVRMDLARRSPEYLDELVQHHVGGHLKVAPEHVSDRVLEKMKKPPQDDFLAFAAAFEDASRRAGKEQYLVPYFIASHPGSDMEDMIELAVYLKQNGYKPRQVQDFIPSPLDLASAMYHTGLDPQTLQPIPVAKGLRDRKTQRALMQFFLPEHWFEVHKALVDAGRRDLIGDGPSCLIPSRPPKEARDKKRKGAAEFGKYVHERGQRPQDRDAKGNAMRPDKDKSDWDGFTGYRDGEGREEPATSPEPRSVGYRPHRKAGPPKKKPQRR